MWPTERARELLARYDRAVLDRSPMAGYAGLHRIAPVALLVIGAFVLAGGATTTQRYVTNPADLISAPVTRDRYAALDRQLDRLNRIRRPSEVQRRRKRALALRMERVAEAHGLRGCDADWNSFSRDYYVYCEASREVRLDGGGALFLGASFLIGWLYFQLRKSWLLPRWSPRLWYTPTYAAVIGLVMCTPFLMYSSDLLLFLVLLLQVTAVTVHVVMTHASARFGSRRFWEVMIDALVRSAARPARIGELSIGLLPAWGVLLLGALLQENARTVGWVDRSLAAAGYLACLLHVLASRAAELGLKRQMRR